MTVNGKWIRRLYPQVADVALADCFGWPEQPWLRAVMLASIDGAVGGPDGLSKSLTGPPDQALFRHLRAGADAVIAGAQTVRAESYQPMRVRPQTAAARRARGQREAPQLVIVSNRLELDFAAPLFHESALPVLVATAEVAPAAQLARAREAAEVLVFAGRSVPPAELLATLRHRGMPRINCEGGPRLLREFLAADLVDEYDLTIAPVAAADSGHWPHEGRGTGLPRPMTLAELFELEGFLFTRYLRA